MSASQWLIWVHNALQGLRHWPLVEPSQVLLWLLLWCFLLIWGLALALARPVTTADAPRPPWPAPFHQLLDAWPLAAALFPALLGLTPVLPSGLRGLFRVSILALIALVTLYGQTRSKAEQQREQQQQLLAFTDRATDLFLAAGDLSATGEDFQAAAGDRRTAADQRRALEEAIAAEEAISGEEAAP